MGHIIYGWPLKEIIHSINLLNRNTTRKTILKYTTGKSNFLFLCEINFQVEELVQSSGGEMDEQLKNQFEDITRTILSNQTEALSNLTKKVEKEIGQVWRQMGIMYGQVSNSISILEKVKASTEGYVNNTSKNLGTMEGIEQK